MKQVKIFLTNGDVLNLATYPEQDDGATLEEMQQSLKRYVGPDASLWGELNDNTGFLVASDKIQFIQFFGFKKNE